MILQENINLKTYNTFGIAAYTQYFAAFQHIEMLQELISSSKIKSLSKLILGGGSNMLLTKDYEGIVLKNEIDFKEIVEEDEHHIVLKVGAGVNWHELVMHCVANNWGGIENLSLIPGCVGASPMQNIGAYGVEVKGVITQVEAIDVSTLQQITFTNSDCKFGYRESIFKNEYKGQFIITAVYFKLNKQPIFNISYGAIETELAKMGVATLSIKAISDAVIRIRTSKLPDPKVIGNAGSFFKNPSIEDSQFELLQNEFPNIVGYKNETSNTVKLAAGWLIEQCGFKGYRKGDAGCHALQALVLVNYGTAKGNEIVELSKQIITAVQEKFKVTLQREVNLI
jgi:UDP-N-acetylmuramate dehydrogenase